LSSVRTLIFAVRSLAAKSDLVLSCINKRT
jgi:hypothetical protein